DGLIGHGRFIYDPQLNLKLRDFVVFLSKGGHLTVNLTVPEGSRIREIAGILHKELKIDSASFVERTNNEEILTRYGIPAVSLEGYLYPETYNFNESDSIDDIIDRMVNTYRSKTAPFKKLIEKSGYTEHEILTLASIIQGEVMVFDEIYKISAVYNNRLRKGMLMQSDPTVQYLFDKPKRLLNKDIAIDSPYNTYLYKGLPPGPVNNPSVKAVKAALEPEDVPYIYMVAKGDGSHNFNTDLQGHLRDKAEFDKIRKKFK
ncbi:MAG: endolytic transglycosylase MltG, partial [Candidatus Delongbacteria bacterium]|nr:endolytic transglycosylase MltG [Candidatus Delongbacteria bacterium]